MITLKIIVTMRAMIMIILKVKIIVTVETRNE